ncbi:MAG: hydrogenase iron-sulfur subunit [Candidatus Thorarchaeota archaeon]|nr:MAG: hydrogenase iron-sulfur subunit [Candidatus Thorarchaeota archaeon]
MDKRNQLLDAIRAIAVKTPTNDVEVPKAVVGFGTIEYKAQTCSACKKCILACEPGALDIEGTLNMHDYLRVTVPQEGFRSKNRETLVTLLQNLKGDYDSGDVQAVPVPEGLSGYGSILWSAEQCIACEKCIEACPENCFTLQKTYRLPEIVGTVEAPPTRPVDKDWEPFIVCFVCWECSHAAADLAGLMHLNYPASIRTIRIPCSGALEPIHIMTALEQGADGVLVTGCLLSECHYGGDSPKAGNFMQYDFVKFWSDIFEEIGIGGRLYIDFASAAMGIKFAQIVETFTDQIKKLGPSPIPVKTEVQE